MSGVWLYVEHPPTREETAALVGELGRVPHRGGPVTVLLATRASVTSLTMDEIAAARGLPFSAVRGDIRAERATMSVDAHRQLRRLVAALRLAGYPARGELLPRTTARALVRELCEGTPDTVVLVTGSHRLAHAVHHDLGARLRHRGIPEVVAVHA